MKLKNWSSHSLSRRL